MYISLDTLLRVMPEVTGTSGLTDAGNQDISEALASELTNTLQLSLFEWMNGVGNHPLESNLLRRK